MWKIPHNYDSNKLHVHLGCRSVNRINRDRAVGFVVDAVLRKHLKLCLHCAEKLELGHIDFESAIPPAYRIFNSDRGSSYAILEVGYVQRDPDDDCG